MTAHIESNHVEDRLAVGTLAIEGYLPIAEHLRNRLGLTESIGDCMQFTHDFRKLLGPLEAYAP
jgi:hypothetical protein